MSKSFVRGAAAIAVIMLMTPAQDALAERLPSFHLCKRHFHRGIAYGWSRDEALAQAIAFWQFAVMLHDGPDSAPFTRACDKWQVCATSATTSGHTECCGGSLSHRFVATWVVDREVLNQPCGTQTHLQPVLRGRRRADAGAARLQQGRSLPLCQQFGNSANPWHMAQVRGHQYLLV